MGNKIIWSDTDPRQMSIFEHHSLTLPQYKHTFIDNMHDLINTIITQDHNILVTDHSNLSINQINLSREFKSFNPHLSMWDYSLSELEANEVIYFDRAYKKPSGLYSLLKDLYRVSILR